MRQEIEGFTKDGWSAFLTEKDSAEFKEIKEVGDDSVTIIEEDQSRIVPNSDIGTLFFKNPKPDKTFSYE